jgi:putative ABC transport system permease protein
MSAAQSLVLSAATLRGIHTRAVSSAVALLGFAGITIMLVILLSGREAIRAMYERSGRDDVALVLSGVSLWEIGSFISPNVALEVARMPGIAHDTTGPLLSREFAAGAPLRVVPKIPGKMGQALTGRGVTPAAFANRRDFQVLSGRAFDSGKFEVIVGRAVAELRHIKLGDELRLNRTNMKVVGIFGSGGSPDEMEVWADKPVYENLIVPPGNRNGYTGPFEVNSSLRVRLAAPNGLAQLTDAIAASTTAEMKNMKVHVLTERQFLSAQSKGLIESATKAAIAVGLVMGVGALFGAINTMYAAVAHRSREIATLRALGFQSFPVAVSVMSEALALGLGGGLIGIVVALAATQNLQFNVYNSGASANVALHFTPTPAVIGIALGYVLVLGMISSILPCMRALRGSITAGLFAR